MFGFATRIEGYTFKILYQRHSKEMNSLSIHAFSPGYISSYVTTQVHKVIILYQIFRIELLSRIALLLSEHGFIISGDLDLGVEFKTRIHSIMR